MKVSKKSWHYRFMASYSSCPPEWNNNLCSYLQNLIGLLVAYVLVFTAIILSLIISAIAISYRFHDMIPPDAALIWSVAAISILMIVCSAKVSSKVDLSDNIVISYLSAKKDKVCPFIEFTED